MRSYQLFGWVGVVAAGAGLSLEVLLRNVKFHGPAAGPVSMALLWLRRTFTKVAVGSIAVASVCRVLDGP